MRKPTNRTIEIVLKNGLSIKGSYKYSLKGCYFDFFVVNKMGYVLGRQNFMGIQMLKEAGDMVTAGIEKLASILIAYKIDQVNSEKGLAAVVPVVIKRAFDRNTFDTLKAA